MLSIIEVLRQMPAQTKKIKTYMNLFVCKQMLVEQRAQLDY